MNRFTPLVRISLGLVLVTTSIMISFDLIGLVPSPADKELQTRVQLCETLAVHAATAVKRSDLASVRNMVQATVKRNEDVLSVGLRLESGRLFMSAGEHDRLWEPPAGDASTPTHVRVPIYKAGKPWATLEMRFADLGAGGTMAALWDRPLVRMIVLLAITGFAAYMLYMRRTLKHLDPSAVIPTRVQAALDVMAEGVVILDEHERIVLANTAFGSMLGRDALQLMGLEPATLAWRQPNSGELPHSFPWRDAIAHAEMSPGTRLVLTTDKGPRSFVVKAAPVLEKEGKAKGAIATFDDVTEFEKQSRELAEALERLEKSEEELRLQNEELEVLARTDPLTGILNRRAFMDTFEPYFAVARRDGRAVCCVMADLDLFKDINDSAGHVAGDDVIRRVAELLSSEAQSHEVVCRYGGEEFCVFLRDTSIAEAAAWAERMRGKVASPGFARSPVTSSFGVSSISGGARSLLELINQADEALYAAKQSGRNRVARWDERGGRV